MKIRFTDEEKKLAYNQVTTMAIEAAQIGEEALYKNLIRLANKFSAQTLDSYIKRYEAEMLLDVTRKTVVDLETEVLPKVNPENKEKIEMANNLIATGKSFVQKVESALK